jgi:hypothetical protein
MTVPDWLHRRAGALKAGVQPETWFVLVGGEPHYKLEVRPAAGRFACAVAQTASGRRLDEAGATYESFDAALRGGLEQLRERLGW